MSARTVYEGSIPLAATGYTHTVPHDDDWVDVAIEGLDVRLSNRAVLGFVLDYPFERPYEGRLVTDAGPTLRALIDAARVGFGVMYRGTVQEDIPGMVNKRVTGAYGEAMHVMGDLVIARIDIDEDAGSVAFEIES